MRGDPDFILKKAMSMSLRINPGRLCLALMLAAAGVSFAQADMTLTHVHGLAYSMDGKRLVLPSHHGLAVYEKGKWSKAPGPRHDYMGFAATRDRLYSSGHPAPGSGLVNPFGLIRSGDGGKTWDKLGFEGQSDFHLLATGWNTNAIYAWNPEPNERLQRPGLYFTLNEGLKWTPAVAAGLAGVARKEYAIATFNRSVFISPDGGHGWKQIARHGEAE